MNSKLFGTDGIRGLSNSYPITVEVAMKIGIIIGNKFFKENGTKRVVIGKDTRLSSYMIENAITSGLLASGMNVMLVGPVPTPALGFLTRSMRCDLGVMISASHNEFKDNGIKFFDKNGEKFSDELQKEIEDAFNSNLDLNKMYCKPQEIGRAKRLDDVSGRYVEFVKRTFPQVENLTGMRVVIDTANGAAYKIAKEVLWELGADVIAIGDKPDGTNINYRCGSTDLALLQKTVTQTRSDIGIALDGDADRIIVVDEKGDIIDGDQIIASLATDMQVRQKLKNDIVITTVMSNYGLDKFLNSIGIQMIRTDVGDKKVYNEMKKYNSMLGGEQSGHIILRKYATTGDGLMVTLHILAILKHSNKKASQILRVFKQVPQYSEKMKHSGNLPDDINEQLKLIKEKYENKIENSRIVIRKSGTEPIIRIMIECETDQTQTIKDIKKEISSLMV